MVEFNNKNMKIIVCNSFVEFYQAVKKCYEKDKILLFRGHCNSTYGLTPSLFRNNNFKKESEYYHKIMIDYPEEFSKKDHLSNLVKLQHFGLPTRLLDFSKNMLVALYFACRDGHDVNGDVIVVKTSINKMKHHNSDTVLCLASLPLLNENDKNEILKFCKNTRDKTLDKKTYDTNISIHHLYHEIRSEYSTFDFEIVPQDLLTFQFVACNQDNKRIKAQDGCFAIFGLDKDLSEKELEKCVECHLIIPAKAKINVLKELEHLGINEKSIYPGLENSMLYLMSKKNNPNNIF